MEDRPLLDEQIAYYRARAPEYDEWFLRRGRYDRGEAHTADWFRDVAILEAALRDQAPLGDVLELACGTGLWTRRLAALGAHVHAVDASAEAIAINRRRTESPAVDYEIADLFSWRAARSFDFVFFSFWLSHVPPQRFDAFWDAVRPMLRPGGRAFFIDSLDEPTSAARDHGVSGGSGIARRRLNDGREFHIVKRFYEPSALERTLAERGWKGWVRSSGRFFLYGVMSPRERRDTVATQGG